MSIFIIEYSSTGSGPETKRFSKSRVCINGCFRQLVGGLIVLFCCYSSNAATLALTVLNPTELDRESVTVEIPWAALVERLPNLGENGFALTDLSTGLKVVTQSLDFNDERILLFQSDFTPFQTKRFLIDTKASTAKADLALFAGFMMGREDFAWENDRIAFRVYGPQVQKWEKEGNPAGLISSGIDVWAKRTAKPMIEKWYRNGHDYHTDYGDGLDFYSVGKSRGCGGIALREEGQLYVSENFIAYRILASGPIRLVFELDYGEWECGKRAVSETKRITMDAGSNLYRVDTVFHASDGLTVEALIGLAKRTETELSKGSNYLTSWESQPDNEAKLGCAILVPSAKSLGFDEDEKNHFVVLRAQLEAPLTYYAGAGWTKSGQYDNRAAWEAYVAKFAKVTKIPLRVNLGDQIDE